MFTEEDRRIFGPFFNGAEEVYADPIEIDERLSQCGDRATLNRLIEQAREGEGPLQFQAREKLIPAIDFAFKMVPFDPKTGKGRNRNDCIRALNLYLEFSAQKKTSGGDTPTSSPPTEWPHTMSFSQGVTSAWRTRCEPEKASTPPSAASGTTSKG